jgi:hypothetical protein
VGWIEEIQRSLGEPVLAFAQEHWIFLLIAGFIAFMWLYGSNRGGGGIGVWFGFGGDRGDDGNSDDGGDGGGGDGGGGGD